MSSAELSQSTPAALRRSGPIIAWQPALASLAWLMAGGLTRFYSDATRHWPLTDSLANAELAAAVAIAALALAGVRLPELNRRLRHASAWLIALGLLLALWELGTASLHCCPCRFSRRRKRWSPFM